MESRKYNNVSQHSKAKRVLAAFFTQKKWCDNFSLKSLLKKFDCFSVEQQHFNDNVVISANLCTQRDCSSNKTYLSQAFTQFFSFFLNLLNSFW